MAHAPTVGVRPVVLSVGGSVLVTGQGDLDYLRDLAALLRRLAGERTLVVTTGGGRTAREYIALGRSLGLTEVDLDELGIDVTRLHARLLAALVGPPAPVHIPTTVSSAVHEAHRASPVILGGTEPGHTTDGVAALVAARLRAERLVNATSVEGVYDQDPRHSSSARRLERMSWKEFRGAVDAHSSGEAGQQFVFDRLGAEALTKAGIPLIIVHGRDLKNLEAALLGRPSVGTIIG